MPIGPSTLTAPYLIAAEPNVRFVSITTVGDPLPGDDGPFVGIPDGIGALDNGDGTITVLVNHELRPDRGSVRDHGSTGAFIDRLVIDKATLEVLSANDLIQSVQLWNDSTDSYVSGTTAFNRFCSGDLAEITAFYNPATGLGTSARIYLTGEEAGPEGRGFATVVTGSAAGTAYELPSFGNLSYENAVANPLAQDKTLVAITDDTTGGQVYLYVGQKQSTGSEIAKAGLSGGDLYGIKVIGFADEVNGTPANGTFTLQEMGSAGDVSNMTGAQLELESDAEGVTGFLRPEDAAWDPDNPAVLYFVTTASFNENSRLYKMTFTDIANPQLGGKIEAVLDGSEGQRMFDNISVANGKVILQEDPGNQPYLARVWEYDIATDKLVELAKFDPAVFTPGLPGFITQEEESSGVIDVTAMLGDTDTRAYLVDAQVHKATDPATTVEQGQLMVMYVDDPFLIGGNGRDDLFGSAADETLRGGNGDDTARAGSGADQLFGGNGVDTLFGGAGHDLLLGERGDDRLSGDAGNDTLTGGQGADLFLFDNRSETGTDTITDFGKGDLLLTTVALSDPDGNGRIDFGATLGLFGSSSVKLDNTGKNVSSLTYTGTVDVDGTLYFAYGTGKGSGSGLMADALIG